VVFGKFFFEIGELVAPSYMVIAFFCVFSARVRDAV
jgi:hypothetical protein